MSFIIKGQPKLTGQIKGRDLPLTTPLGELALTLNNPGSQQWFGIDVDVYGDNVIVGAVMDSYPTIGVGAAYIYDTNTGALKHTINSPSGSQTAFGSQVAINGTYAIVAERMYGTSHIGRCHVYDVATGAFVRTFNNPRVSEGWGQLGVSIDIDNNSNYAILGAHGNDSSGVSDSGRAYIVNCDTGDMIELNNPTPQASDNFGRAVTINGNYVAVGSRLSTNSFGEVYIFDTLTGTPVRTISNPDPNIGDSFGVEYNSIKIEGDYIVIGAKTDGTDAVDAGRAYVFNITTGALLYTLTDPIPAVGGQFGNSVGISGDAIVVGKPFATSGEVHVFSTSTGSFLYSITNPEGWQTSFGTSVSVDGNKIIVGSRYSNSQVGKTFIYN